MTRIVINPSTFKNGKDALCVAFNERFRIAMEQYGFEPQSEPTDRQRRFFSDTAYADDEVQLRRTILARILTLDTSVKDPTDEQLREAFGFLQEFKRRETPSNDWEASAIERLEILVRTVVNKGERAAPRPQGGTVRADIGGGTTKDEGKTEQSNTEIDTGSEAATTSESPEPEMATPETATTPESPESGQVVTNNGVVMTEEESQRTADELKKSLFGDADNSADAAITDEPKVPEAPKVPEMEPQQTPAQQTPAQQTPVQQTPVQQTPAQQTPAQQTPAQQTPAQQTPAQVPQPEPVTNQVGRWTTKNQRRMRRYLRALYGKDYAYAAVYGASPMAKPPTKAVPRKKA